MKLESAWENWAIWQLRRAWLIFLEIGRYPDSYWSIDNWWEVKVMSLPDTIYILMWGCNVLSANVNNVGMILMEPEHFLQTNWKLLGGVGGMDWAGNILFNKQTKTKQNTSWKQAKPNKPKTSSGSLMILWGFAMTNTGAKRLLDKLR